MSRAFSGAVSPGKANRRRTYIPATPQALPVTLSQGRRLHFTPSALEGNGGGLGR